MHKVLRDREETDSRAVAGGDALTVLPHHERTAVGIVIAWSGVDPIVGLHARVELAGDDLLFGHLTFRDAGLRIRVRIVARDVAALSEVLAVRHELIGVGDTGAHFFEANPKVAAGYLRHLDGRLMIDGHGCRPFRRDCEDVVLSPNVDRTGRGHGSQSVLQRGRLRARGFDDLLMWVRLRKAHCAECQRYGQHEYRRGSQLIPSWNTFHNL
jgi:hypothetical protein